MILSAVDEATGARGKKVANIIAVLKNNLTLSEKSFGPSCQ
jgi:hypothetical protein